MRDAVTVGKDILGKIIVKKTADGRIMSGRITEVEAYMGTTDKASHSYGGRRTKRTEVMYKEGGYSYVFLIYGMYECFNVTAGREGDPQAVLIRGVEPLENKNLMWEKRKVKKEEAPLPENAPYHINPLFFLCRLFHRVKNIHKRHFIFLRQFFHGIVFRIGSRHIPKSHLLYSGFAVNRFHFFFFSI